MTYNSRFFNAPALRKIVELTDSIADECQSVADALGDYESANDLTGQDKTAARDEAREAAWAALGDLLAEADKLRAEYDRINQTLDAVA